jgi:sugar phosphate isomerase/epimerase
MILGCNTLLFESFDLETALRSIAWAGFSGAELAAIIGMAEHLKVDDGPEHVAEVKQLADRYGLVLTAIEGPTTDAQRLLRTLQVAADAGIPIVNIGSGGQTGDEASFQESIEFLGEMSRKAAGLGITLSVKAHAGAAVHNTETMRRLVAAMTSPGFGVDVDTSHVYRAGELPEEFIRGMGKSLVHVHVRDAVTRGRLPPPTDQVPGRGKLDMAAIFMALKEIGFDGPINLEMVGAAQYELWQVVGVAAESRGYLNRCAQNVGYP